MSDQLVIVNQSAVSNQSSPAKREQEGSGQSTRSDQGLSITVQVEKLKTGYTRLPNAILMEMIHGNLSKSEIEILLLIARFTISYRDSKTDKERKFAAISKGTIALYTGVQGKNILRSLQGLEAKGLIRKIQGSFDSKNQFGLVYPDDLFDRIDVSSRENDSESGINAALAKSDDAPAPEMPGYKIHPRGQNSTHGEDRKVPYLSDQKGPQPQDQKSTHYKQVFETNIINNTYTNYLEASPETCQSFIQDYVRSISVEKKRSSEWEKFLILKTHRRLAEIATGLSYLLKFGTPKTSIPCHSPMAFLTVAFPAVLQAVGEVKSAGVKLPIRPAVQSLSLPHNRENLADIPKPTVPIEDSTDEGYAKARKAFEKAFPSAEDRKKYFDEFVESKPFFRTYKYLEKMAIFCWADGNQALIAA